LISDEINQICFVFTDIEKNIEIYKKLFKFSSEINILDVKVRKNIYKEKINPFKIKLAMATMGKTQIEFIQPLEGESIYKKFLEEKGVCVRPPREVERISEIIYAPTDDHAVIKLDAEHHEDDGPPAEQFPPAADLSERDRG